MLGGIGSSTRARKPPPSRGSSLTLPPCMPRDAVDDREAEAGAAAAAGGFQPRERLQHALGLLARNAGPAVEHFDERVACSCPVAISTSPPAVTQRVVDEIAEQPLHRAVPQGERRHGAERERTGFAGARVARDDAFDQRVQVAVRARLLPHPAAARNRGTGRSTRRCPRCPAPARRAGSGRPCRPSSRGRAGCARAACAGRARRPRAAARARRPGASGPPPSG